MARMKCVCGCSLSNSSEESSNEVTLFDLGEVRKRLAENPNLTVGDLFYETPFAVEWWYCPNCESLLKLEPGPDGRLIDRFSLSDSEESATDAWLMFKESECATLTELECAGKLAAWLKTRTIGTVVRLVRQKQ